jgi:hypothetical protein
MPAGGRDDVPYQESGDRDQINYRRLRRRRKIVETPIGFLLSPVS